MNRYALALTFAVILGVAAAIYLVVPPRERPRPMPPDPPRAIETAVVIDPPFVMFRALAPADVHGRLAMVSAAGSGVDRHIAALSCARVHFAGGTGLCLVEEAAGTNVKHAAYIFDHTFTRLKRIELGGVPIRARVAPNGRRAAITVYQEEHQPNGEERLAIESVVLDVDTGGAIANLHEFTVDNAGNTQLVPPIDFTGVAFEQDGDHFFATLATPTERYVVRGSIAARQLAIVRSGVANEALSRDGKRLIVKKRVGEGGYWQLLVLDLDMMTEQELNQGPGSVDDQVEWLDDAHVVYHDATEEGTGVWVLSTDGVNTPRLLIRDAYSPAVQQ